jgi:hypothetical protein
MNPLLLHLNSVLRSAASVAACAVSKTKRGSDMRFAQVLPVTVVGCALVSFALSRAASQTQALTSSKHDAAPLLVVGFMGGFVHGDDVRHSEVQVARQLEVNYGDRVRVQMFENRQRAAARKWILQLTEGDSVGSLGQEWRTPRIVLFGHSWGASAAIYLARELKHDGIPVALTIQVDSIRKSRKDDSVIPANVSQAINFYQTRGILRGRTTITAEDPSRTRILGNVHVTYEKLPSECRSYPWYDRLLFKGHTAIECDPRVWSQVEHLISMQLPDVGTQPSVETALVSH